MAGGAVDRSAVPIFGTTWKSRSTRPPKGRKRRSRCPVSKHVALVMGLVRHPAPRRSPAVPRHRPDPSSTRLLHHRSHLRPVSRRGTHRPEPCQTCRGATQVQADRKLTVKIPPGICDWTAPSPAWRANMAWAAVHPAISTSSSASRNTPSSGVTGTTSCSRCRSVIRRWHWAARSPFQPSTEPTS